ncbi:hypothetical protein CCC_03384 [Paramagnetospirillum magnetotacticum MS-1]|uniref:Uncharacterized protein n=1 Tax=Paramagnetospirillum magnetotacticum MS-1 TaxID=272627 RepID=A0A0C2V278_PARME|nr:hypothetical protein [Paramagnetospirillum magnetotacticum]KIL99166.1 hypothetical protein CCC_03384 [Paramagnetospirillum magnetotacticum MS-1]
MGIFRYCRLSLRSLLILIEQFPVFLRLSWLCMTVSLLGAAVSSRHVMAGGITDLLARGVFVVAWLRLVGLGEVPSSRHYFRLGRRESFGALAWVMAEIFVTFPAQVIAASLAIATGVPIADSVMVLAGLSNLLLGGFYLVPADAALERAGKSGDLGWRVPDLMIRGGLALGMAVFICWLPLNLLQEGVRLLPEMDLAEGLALRDAAMVPVRYLGMALTAGTLALAWNSLMAEETAQD